jgi:hypothetical protein
MTWFNSGMWQMPNTFSCFPCPKLWKSRRCYIDSPSSPSFVGVTPPKNNLRKLYKFQIQIMSYLINWKSLVPLLLSRTIADGLRTFWWKNEEERESQDPEKGKFHEGWRGAPSSFATKHVTPDVGVKLHLWPKWLVVMLRTWNFLKQQQCPLWWLPNL